MRDQCRGGVGFPSARRTLNHRLRHSIDAVDDFALVVVDLKRQVVLAVDRHDRTWCGAGF
jgi:hypothetical protein